MFINTTGIVLRETAYNDSSKILTVLTSSEGKLTASAHGAHRKNSKLAASTGLLVYSHMTLTQRKGRWTLTEAQAIEQFLGLRDELRLLALGSYIAELTETVADEDSLNPQLLSICLNALYALSEKIKPPEIVKPAFELRLMAIAGYEPVLWEKSCTEDISASEGAMLLTPTALSAARYILTGETSRIFSFNAPDNALRELASVTENYLLAHLDKCFKTLDYYKKIKNT